MDKPQRHNHAFEDASQVYSPYSPFLALDAAYIWATMLFKRIGVNRQTNIEPGHTGLVKKSCLSEVVFQGSVFRFYGLSARGVNLLGAP